MSVPSLDVDQYRLLRTLYDAVPVAIFVWRCQDGSFVFVDCNPAANELTHGRGVTFIGQTAAEIYPDMPEMIGCFERCRATRQPIRQEMPYRLRSTGELRSFDVTFVFTPPDLVVVHALDLTDRSHAQTALRHSEIRLRALLGAVPDALVEIQRDGTILDYVRGAGSGLERFDLPETLVGRHIRDLLPPDVLVKAAHALARAFDRGDTQHFEHDWSHDTARCWFETRIVPTGDQTALAIVRDVTERHRTEEMLIAHERRLQHLTRRLVQAQEEERARVARELHDDVGQSLTAVKLGLEMAVRSAGGRTGSLLREMIRTVETMLERVRTVTLDLRPPMLDDLGLESALSHLFRRFTQQTGVRVDFDRDHTLPRLAAHLETTAYRIAQEALTNVARHAGVDHASVRLATTPVSVRLEIEDRGAGFDLEHLATGGRTSGLSGMHERALAAGGWVQVTSASGAGTRVLTELPLTRRHDR